MTPFLEKKTKQKKVDKPCQHQCPIVLMDEAKRVHQLMYRLDQPISETFRVHAQLLSPASHPKMAGTLSLWVDCHIVGAVFLSRLEGDAGEQVGDVVHRLNHQDSQICEKWLFEYEYRQNQGTFGKSPIKAIFHYPLWPEPVGIGQDRVAFWV